MGHADGFGGAQTAFKRMVTFFKAEGFDIKIIALTNDSKSDWLIDNNYIMLGTVLHKTIKPIYKITKVLQIIFITIKIKILKPNIFITIGLNNTANILARLINKKTFKIAQDFNGDRNLNDNIWDKTNLLFDGVALQSPHMLEKWKQYNFNISKINWLPCFPETSQKHIIKKKKDFIGIFKIVYFGRLAANKGLDLVINAIAKNDMMEYLTFDIWGVGDEEKNLMDLCIKLNLQNCIRFRGAYPYGKEAAELMITYDLLVLCSTRTEGLPLILLEAMAFGLPLLLTDIGAMRDCTIDNPDAILVIPNIEDIANGIYQAKESWLKGQFDPIRQQNYYDKNFSYSVMANRWKICLDNPSLFFSPKIVK